MNGSQNITHRLYRLERAVESGFAELFRRLESMMYVSQEDYNALKSAVEANTSASHSMIMVLQSYASRFAQSADDSQAVRALAQELQSTADESVAAALKNTPLDPAAQNLNQPGATTQQPGATGTGTGTEAGQLLGDGSAPGTSGTTIAQQGSVGSGGAIEPQATADNGGTLDQ